MPAEPPAALTLRSPWGIVGWLLGLVGLAVGAATASEANPAALVIGLPIAVVSGWAVLRVPLMRVRATSTGLTVHGLLRTRRVRREQVSGVSLEQTDDRDLFEVYTPVVHLRDGTELVLTQLSAATTASRVERGRVGRQTGDLRRILTDG